MRGVVERFTEDRASLRRFHDVRLSAVRRERMRRFYTDWQKKLGAIHFGEIDTEAKIDYLLLGNLLDYELRRIELDEERFAEVEPLIPFASRITGLHEVRRQKEPVAGRDAARQLTELAKQVKGHHEAAKSTELPKHVVHRGVRYVVELRDVLKSWYEFYSGYDPVFTWWAAKPYEELDTALEDYRKLLRGDVLGLDPEDEDTIVGDPIGREALLVDLASEMIPYTPEELIEIGKKELAWCEAEMQKASRELGYGDDWHRALEHVKTLHVEPGEQPQLIRKLALEAIDFVEKRELITVPELAKETWRMSMMSPERQRINPFFLGGESIIVSYPTDTMTHEEKLMSMRGNNIHFSRATVQHELIPGHHLQQFMAARHRPYRRVFRTPFWTEGWALWWELLLWDLDFPQSPENRVGMLFWRMHRCARIIFSLSFHLGRMSPEECIEFLVERVGHERENAEAEVRRSFTGRYSPLYQVAYLMGGLQFRALHAELVGLGKMTNREFHDAILQRNGIPVELIRASLVNQKLGTDFTSSWRFYDEY
ncbi:MAG: DUF885 domain-containing protein [bacterium]|nr:DUF885 domain-containing protein [bacterium]